MADIDTELPYRQQQFIGIDNRNQETKVKPGHVRDLVNVDPTRDGQTLSRRAGYVELRTGIDLHSVWGDGDFPWLLFIENGTLYGQQAAGDTPIALATGFSEDPVSYTRINADVYFSDGTRSGLVTAGGDVHPWACEAPIDQPTLTAVSGDMAPGRYQVAVTYRDALGRESGTGLARIIDLPAGGGIQLTHIPQPVDDGVTIIQVYVSEPNGEVLYSAAKIPVGMTSAGAGHVVRKMPLRTQFHTPLPAGQVITAGHGRLFVGAGRVLYWSDALRYGQGILADNYLRFGATLTGLAAIERSGLYVMSGKRTYWLAGPDPKEWHVETAYTHGAVAGTLSWASGEVWGLETTHPVPSWLATNGQFCVGLPDGQVVTFNANTCATDTADFGASLIRDHNGQRHQITTLRAPNSGAGLSDTWSVEVRRNGVLLP